jgi:starch synthase
MNVLFLSAEVSPFAKTGGLGDVCGALPKALAHEGMDVAVFMPWYRQAREWFQSRGVAPEVVNVSLTVEWAGWRHEVAVLRGQLPGSEVPVYFIANDYFYNRDEIYSNTWSGDDDHLERYVVFCRAVIRVMEILGGSVDVVHAHDWHTALLPVYLHSGLRGSAPFANAASVYTIHNLNYQGRYPAGRFGYTGLHSRYWQPDALEYYGDVHLMKGGILFADQVTTVSPGYAREIQTTEFGAGLDGLLRDHWWKVTGILNGIDVSEWNPAADRHLPARYSAGDLDGKHHCKQALCHEAGFHFDPDRPLIGVVSRLVEQKGFDLLLPILHAMVSDGAQLVILGSGESWLEDALRYAQSLWPDQVRVWVRFDNGLAHRITAGSDILLMPSRYEPCGLNQMYALRYGTLPVVRLTGGLADTVFPLDGPDWWRANGFGFSSATSEAFLGAIRLALETFRRKDVWHELQQRAMQTDFSWEMAARHYIEVYRRALSNRLTTGTPPAV